MCADRPRRADGAIPAAHLGPISNPLPLPVICLPFNTLRTGFYKAQKNRARGAAYFVSL